MRTSTTLTNRYLNLVRLVLPLLFIVYPVVTVFGQASQVTPIGSTIGATDTDDGFSNVSITNVFPHGIDFGGTTYNDMYIGTNGYITFGTGQTAYDPAGIAGWNYGYPIIAAQFDDLDPGKGGDVYYAENTVSGYVVATWDAVHPYQIPVGYYTGTTGTSLQILLRKPAGYSSSNRIFQIEVRYINIGWHRSNNVSPEWPSAGWSTGNMTSYAEMPYSGSEYFHLNQSSSNVGIAGVYRWDVVGGSVLGAPTVNQTNTASSVTGTSAVSGGNVSSDGGASVTVRGVVWSTSSMPSLASHPGGGYSTDGGTGTGSFTSNLTGLSHSTLYYMRAYATNSEGAGYGPQQSFETSSNPPPANPTSVTASANPICNGSPTVLTANGVDGTVYWYTGSCGGTATSPATGNTLTVSPEVNTTYYARNYNNGQFSTNCASITITVAAQPTAPSLTKNPNVASVCVGQSLTVSATSGAGGAGTVTDQYSYSTNNGSSWSAWSTSIPGFNAVVGTNLIRSRRTATASGCNESSYNQVSWGVYQAFTSGAIATTGETICSGTSAGTTIGSTTPASGGDGTITYKWQANGNDIANSDAATYLPGVLTQTTTFTRWAKDGTCNTEFTQSTGNWVVTVNPLLQYRSVQTGNWVTVANWQQYNGSSWVDATSFPGQISNDCSSPLVTIQTGHQMEIRSEFNINIPNLEIKATGKITVKSGGKIFVQYQLQLDENAGGAIIVESD